MFKKNRESVPTESRESKKTLYVEICKTTNSKVKHDQIIQITKEQIDYIVENNKCLPLNKTLALENLEYIFDQYIPSPIQSLYFSTRQEEKNNLYSHEFSEYSCMYHVYCLNEEEAASETMQKDGEEICASTHWILPSADFYQLWDNLFYNEDIKEKLLQYIGTAMAFSERQVNPHIISWNKVILLHGPPGTGKTSLCKALAQKITIRLNDKFTHGQLVEINSHSLFSKWFSESGKLVMNLFNDIRELLQDKNILVCILIDEVESLAHARKACANGSEPSDSVRVVNALLTQLDSLKRHPNVLILTTSNLTEAIDLAFVDRADIKQYIPPPNDIAIYKIYFTCINELIRTGFIESVTILDYSELEYINNRNDEHKNYYKSSFELFELAKESEGLSGRTLRKIPFLTHAHYGQMKICTISEFIKAMSYTVQKERKNHKEFVTN